MKQACFVLSTALALCFFTASVNGATVAWASASSGNWSNPNNWNPSQVPGPSDTAIITVSGNYAVSLDTNTGVSGLILGAGNSTTQTFLLNGESFDLAGPATVNSNGVINLNGGNLSCDEIGDTIISGTLTCSGGTLYGKMTIASNGVANLVGINSETSPISLNELTLTNYGTVIWSNINLECQSHSEVDNYGLWDIQTNNEFYGASGSDLTVFNNFGTVRKDNGLPAPPNYETFFDNTVAFENYGSLDDETGSLVLSAGYGGGRFNSPTNGGLSLGNFILAGDATFTGPGQVQGNLYGENGVIHGALIFDYGSLAGTLTVAADGAAELLGIDGETTPISFEGLTLTNYGAIIWSNINLECQSGSQVYNYGLWDAQTNDEFYGASGSDLTTFNNYGTVRKDGGGFSAPNYITRFDNTIMFSNTGTLDVENGGLNISSGNGGGLFNTATSAGLSLGFFNLIGDATFSGPGPVQGALNGENGVIHGALVFDYGSFSGTLTIASNAVANLVGINGEITPISLNALSLTNCGTVIWSNLDLNGESSSQVYNYGLWDAQTDNTFHGNSGGGPFMTTFNNYGTVRKDGGSTITTFDSATLFNNAGTLDVETDQINIATGSGGGVFNTASNAIVWLGFSDIFTLSGGATFTGPGLVGGDLTGYNGVIYGTLNFYYGALSGTLTIASNAVANLAGLAGNQPISLNALSLTNCGTVIWSNIDLECSSSQIYNYGLWDALTDNTFHGNGGGGPFMSTFNNYGTVRKDGGSTITTFDSATLFNNAGTLDVKTDQINIATGSGGGVFNTASNAIIWLGFSDIFTLSGSATFTGPGLVGGDLTGYNGVIYGSLNFYYGTLSGTLTVASNAVANLAGVIGANQPISLNALSLTNCGTVIWSNIDLECSSSQIYNYGLWDALSDNTFHGSSGGGPFMSTFNNFGIVRKDGGSTITSFDSATQFTNSGTLDVETDEIAISTGSGGGVFNTANHTILSLDSFFLSGSGTFTGSGLVSGNLAGNNGVIHGALTFYSGSWGGTLTVASNAVANLIGTGNPYEPMYLNELVLTNYGTVTWSNTDLECSSAQIYNYGLWDAQYYNSFYGSSSFFINTFNNCGTFRKDSVISTTVFDNTTVFNNSGKTDLQTGLLELEGSCSFTNGTLNFGISGPPFQNGQMAIPGNAPLAGRLSANFENHYSPAVSNSFNVIVYQSETGTFTSLCLPPLPAGLSWQTNYGSTSFTLSVVPAPPLQLSGALNVSGNSISLSWNGQSGQTYQVQCTTNLAANWINLGNPISGTNGPITILDAISANPQKFYRIESQ